MSASSMEKQGKKTEAKVLKALGKKPKTADEVAKRAGVSRGTAKNYLDAAVKENKASALKKGRSTGYAAWGPGVANA